MITITLIKIGLFILVVFSSVVTAIVPNFELPETLGSYVGYVFGNLYLFNSFLPITETLAFAGIALTFKAALFAYEVFMFFTYLFGHVRRTFVSFRV